MSGHRNLSVQRKRSIFNEADRFRRLLLRFDVRIDLWASFGVRAWVPARDEELAGRILSARAGLRLLKANTKTGTELKPDGCRERRRAEDDSGWQHELRLLIANALSS